MFRISKAAQVSGGALVLAAALVMGGCASTAGTSSGTATGKADTAAAGLRAGLDELLREHVVLALAATDAALAGNNDEFTAAAGALDANSHELANAVGSVYGDNAGKAFYDLWAKHIGFVVNYTVALSKKDQAGEDKAVQDLIGYTQDFGAFIESATGGRLKKDAVADLVKTHVVGLKGAIDAQAAKNYADAFSKERDAEKHMDTIGNALADAITDQFPDKF